MNESIFSLTEREKEVCKSIKNGILSYDKIAENLFISKTTIKTHITNIFQKLHIHSFPELVYILMKEQDLND